MAEVIAQFVNLKAATGVIASVRASYRIAALFGSKNTLWAPPRVTLIKGHNSWRQGNNREIVAAHIILLRLAAATSYRERDSVLSPACGANPMCLSPSGRSRSPAVIPGRASYELRTVGLGNGPGQSGESWRGSGKGAPGAGTAPPAPCRAPCLLQTFTARLGLMRLAEREGSGRACISLLVKHSVSESGKELLPREGVRRMSRV